MLDAAHVRADVLDIRIRRASLPSDLVLDANVLYWAYYDFANIRYAKGVGAIPRQRSIYEPFVRAAEAAKIRLHVSPFTLGEFAQAAEYSELDSIWSTDPVPPQPDPSNPVTEFSPRVRKFARYHYSRQLANIRSDVGGMVAKILKQAALLPTFPTDQDLHDHALADWIASCGDFPDATLVAVARHAGITHILSDDRDFATFDGLTLFTANHHTIDAARIAGKLR